MSEQFKRKYGWHLMAWGMAVGYMLLHHTWVLASSHAPAREMVAPAMAMQVRFVVPVGHLPVPPSVSTLNVEQLWPTEGEGGCHLVTLSVDELATRRDNEHDDMQVSTTLCHAWL